jgi:hypothetical protein
MTATSEPQLAPPGAGLPKIELYVARFLFAWSRWTGNRAAFNARFESERLAIQKLVSSCDPQSAACRVLIARVPGLEDSSRYWSLLMTLDHLRIMNRQIAGVITSLAKGVVPPRAASTARVKPDQAVTHSVIAEYEATCEQLMSTVSAIDNLKTSARYTHPWFGPLDASGWHAMAGTHMGIHRVQIERILHGLPATAPMIQ